MGRHLLFLAISRIDYINRLILLYHGLTGPAVSPVSTGVCVKWGPPNLGTLVPISGDGGPHITRNMGPWGPLNSGDVGILQ